MAGRGVAAGFVGTHMGRAYASMRRCVCNGSEHKGVPGAAGSRLMWMSVSANKKACVQGLWGWTPVSRGKWTSLHASRLHVRMHMCVCVEQSNGENI